MPPPRPNPPTPGKQTRRRPGPPGSGVWFWLILGLGLVVMLYLTSQQNTAPLTYSDFLRLVELDKTQPKDKPLIKSISFRGEDRIEGELTEKALEFLSQDKKLEPIRKKFEDKKTSKFEFVLSPLQLRNEEFAKRVDALILEKQALKVDTPVDSFSWIGPVFMFMLPIILILLLLFIILPRFRDPLGGGGGFLNNYVKSPARRYDRSKMRVTFENVADMTNAKVELREIVEFLKSPEKFQKIGAEVPKGVLLVGPPGTGKTLLARAVAGEAGVPFFSINGSEFIQMFVGVGASRVRDMFKTAKENAPCILFIDEIDAVGRMRGAGVGGGSDEREQTLNQILGEMDGFTPTETVIVVAATNRPDVLDAALLRPGRFDRHVTIDRPSWQGRKDILKIHTKNKPLDDNVDLERVAKTTIGMTGADLRNLANEAALLAAREGQTRIYQTHFARALDRVMMGPEREVMMTDEDKRRVAYHEAGHTLVAVLEAQGETPEKVSIVPRGRAGGVTITIPTDEDRIDYGLDYFKARLVMTMGGRAADRLMYGQAYSGQESDLKQATKLARYMVTHWGMSDRLGPMAFRVGEEHVFLGKEIQEARDFSDGTARIIDEEVQALLREADERAHQLLQDNRDKLDNLVNALVDREELLRDEIEMVIKGEQLPPQEKPVPKETASTNGTPPKEGTDGKPTEDASQFRDDPVV